MKEFKIYVRNNVYGGNYAVIDIDSDIKTEVNVFRGIKEANISEILKLPNMKPELSEIEIFSSKTFKYDIEKK